METKKDLLESIGAIFFDAIKEAEQLTKNLEKMDVFISDQEKLIVKFSGETFVARADGKDYICIEPGEMGMIKGYSSFMEAIDTGDFSTWKYISSTKMTDTIAKLRPMVVHLPNNAITKLFGVDVDRRIITVRGWHSDVGNFRLATVDDLD